MPAPKRKRPVRTCGSRSLAGNWPMPPAALALASLAVVARGMESSPGPLKRSADHDPLTKIAAGA